MWINKINVNYNKLKHMSPNRKQNQVSKTQDREDLTKSLGLPSLYLKNRTLGFCYQRILNILRYEPHVPPQRKIQNSSGKPKAGCFKAPHS